LDLSIKMLKETKRDEVHKSVRYGTLDSPYGLIQGLPQARCKAASSTSAARIGSGKTYAGGGVPGNFNFETTFDVNLDTPVSYCSVRTVFSVPKFRPWLRNIEPH
jgi:hypothetical protein